MTNKLTSGSARRIAPGDTITTRELTTIRSERILLPAPGVLTHLQFRRYADVCLVSPQIRRAEPTRPSARRRRCAGPLRPAAVLRRRRRACRC